MAFIRLMLGDAHQCKCCGRRVSSILSCYLTFCLAQITEEEDEPIYIEEPNRGDYIVVFDPLDGSSNIDCGVSGMAGPGWLLGGMGCDAPCAGCLRGR
jgi:hypothetical protein